MAVLKKIEKRGALEQASKIRRRCGEVLRFAVVTGRAKYNFAPDLAIALNKPKQNHFPFLTEKRFQLLLKRLKGIRAVY